ncbi:sulfotransferase [Antribacter sp. KLBMP9083]|uniref:Sulfotransferase n=1 Tax=Antribacter soli TaxID=2910976 RepID=A0AA41QCV2_9MICO|nr:sulfotransferase [Antribacter soli]MCF4120787.1 sulfotransferase [Antribacter soli]
MSRTPRTTRALNTVLAPVIKGYEDPARSWAKAVAQVEKKAGAQDRQFADDLGMIVQGAAEISRLSPLGWFLIISDVKEKYANRLRVNRVLSEHPQITDEPITAPVIVCGLPRTATTLAHRVLSASPDHRAPLTWEMMHTGLNDPQTARKVIKQLEQSAGMMERFAPDIPHIHPIHIDRPEESMIFMPHGSYWEILHGLMPTYSAWLAERDVTGDYEYLKLGLQVLQHGRERKRWVLKYPAHLGDMDMVKKVFPDATFVWTHRDPTTVIGSFCSLMETFWGMYQHDADRQAIGRFALAHLVTQVERGLELRRHLPPSSIVDVPYHKLSADPFTEVPRLYSAIGATWTARDHENLAAVIAKPKGTPSHQYDLSRYLDPAEVEETFAPYNRLLDRLDLRDAEPAVEL